MAKVIYVSPTSLNGYIADETGDFDWAAPDEEVHAVINDIVRPIGTFLYASGDASIRPMGDTKNPANEQVPNYVNSQPSRLPVGRIPFCIGDSVPKPLGFNALGQNSCKASEPELRPCVVVVELAA